MQTTHTPSQTSASQHHYDTYWENTESSYPHYPTIRHRKRFILNAIRAHCRGRECAVFDFGCGEGTLLKDIQGTFHMPANRIGGSDISAKAVERCRAKISGGTFHHNAFPSTGDAYDIIVCSEVIEHTMQFREILEWIFHHLASGGLLILTTQTGNIHASDRYTGHTQHFEKSKLDSLLKDIGYDVVSSRLWGWPLFTLQKFLTDIRFDHVRDAYLEGSLTLWKKFVFDLATALYYAHDLIPYGPQIYVTARKGGED